jgi:hypothetical protein
MNVDFGRTAGDYGRHRAGFPTDPLPVPHRVWALIARRP